LCGLVVVKESGFDKSLRLFLPLQRSPLLLFLSLENVEGAGRLSQLRLSAQQLIYKITRGIGIFRSSGLRIWDGYPDPNFSIPYPGVKKAPDPTSRSAKNVTKLSEL
jgi:hypothetical protein